MGAAASAEHPPAFPAEPPVRTSLRVIWLIGLVYAVAAATHPGTSGRHLAGLVLTATTGVGWIGWVTARQLRKLSLSAAAIVVLAATGGVLAVLGPIGVAVVGVAGMCAASLLGIVPAAALTVLGVGASVIAVAATGHSAGPIGGAASGAAAGLVVGMGRRQAQERVRQEAELIVSEQRLQIEHDRAEVLAERNRIAREVHDVLAHTLSALSVQIEATRSLVDDGAGPADVHAALARSRRLVTEGLDETRRAVRALRDEPVDILAQITVLAEDQTAVRVEGAPRPVATATGLALVRVAQEAVTNARKHAPGAPIRITLVFGPAAVALSIDNDAAATVSSLASTGGGYGLQGMRERIELTGGTLTAGPHDCGWRVSAEVPA